MDFGDILDQWDQQTAGPPKSGRTIPDGSERKTEPAPKTDPLTAWLRINDIPDKDAEVEDTALYRGERRRRLLAKRAEAVLDLHGLTRDDAWTALDEFFRSGRQRGLDKLLIIHGKGNHSEGEAVLKRTVRDYIETCPFAGESGHSSAIDGGTGSTWVLLKDT